MSNVPRLISFKDTAERLAVSRAYIYEILKNNPEFPRPVRVNGRRVAFVEAEITEFAHRRIAAREPFAKKASA